MGITVEQVRRWRPGTLSAMADDATAKAHDYETATTAGFTPLRELAGSWVGKASDAADARVAREQKAATYATESIMNLRDALNSGAGELTAAKNRVLDVVDSIESSGCKLIGGTTVETTTSLGPNDDHPLIAKQVVQKLAWELTDALRQAEQTDARVAREIEAALKAMTAQARAPYSQAGGQSTDAAAAAYLGPNAKPLPSDPAAMAKLWSRLSNADKEALFAKYPDLGNHDGIPCDERDLYNRQYLDTLKQRTQTEISAIEATDPSDPQVAALKQQLAGYDAVEKGMEGQPPRYLLHIDDGGRAAISINNPDTADETGTYVPGVGSNMSNIGGGLTTANNIYQSAKQHGAGANTAVVAWYGYNAPSQVGTGVKGFIQGYTGGAIGPLDDITKHAGVTLDSFQGGLAASHIGAPGEHIVIAHSLGTTVTGQAATEGSLHADKVALLGSPGEPVEHADELHLIGSDGQPIPADQVGAHVFAGKNPHDPIPLAANPELIDTIKGAAYGSAGGPIGGVVGGTLGSLWGAVHQTIDPSTGGPLGTDPTDSSFGAQSLATDSDHSGPAITDHYDFSMGAHTHYFDIGTRSLDAVGGMFAPGS